MACGTPVIGADVGGIKYSVADGQTGFLVPPHKPDALAEKIIHLLSDEKLYRTMQKNAIRRVNRFFTWSKVADGVHQLYRAVLLANKKEKAAEQEHASPLESLSLLHIEKYLLNDSIYNKLKVQQ
jgi:glycogen synthase